MIPSTVIPLPIDPDVAARVDQLELPFNDYGIDPYGVDRKEVARFMTFLGFMYRRYFQARTLGAQHIPARGRAMLVGNHSGGVAVDAGLVIASAFFELDPPRLAQGMAEKFIARFPFASQFTNRVGQFTGLPRHAIRLLEDDRLLMVFPEGARGTAKLFPERDSLVRFGTGFVRLALQTGTPIVPLAFVGGGEAVPTIANLKSLGKMLGIPYLPVTPYLLPLPLPVRVVLLYGEPIHLEGTGRETDGEIQEHVETVKRRIRRLIEQGRDLRDGKLGEEELDDLRDGKLGEEELDLS